MIPLPILSPHFVHLHRLSLNHASNSPPQACSRISPSPPGIPANTTAAWMIGSPAQTTICSPTMKSIAGNIPNREPFSSIRIPFGVSGRVCRPLSDIAQYDVILRARVLLVHFSTEIYPLFSSYHFAVPAEHYELFL